MPLCYCFTSLSSSSIEAGFEERLSKRVADVLDKPTERITIILNCDARICKAESVEPAFVMQVHSIGVFDKDRNPGYFSKFFDFLTAELNLPAHRINVQFVDIEGHSAKTEFSSQPNA